MGKLGDGLEGVGGAVVDGVGCLGNEVDVERALAGLSRDHSTPARTAEDNGQLQRSVIGRQVGRRDRDTVRSTGSAGKTLADSRVHEDPVDPGEELGCAVAAGEKPAGMVSW